MSKFLAALCACVCMCAFGGNDYYVDANYGRDDDPAYDGSAPDKAKKTLAAAMAIDGLKSGDTVWAAEGDYNDGEMIQDNSLLLHSRVVVPEGVTLAASGRQSETFITGRPASGDGVENAAYGLGYNALRCVYLKKNARVRGFTCRNGYTRGATDASGATVDNRDRYGAAILTWAEAGTYAENCRIVGCVADYCQVGYARFINCSFLFCTNAQTACNIGYDGKYCNCLFDHNRGGRVTMYAQVLLNCTLGPDNRNASGTSAVDAMWGVNAAGYVYSDVLFVQQGTGNGGAQTDCILDSAPKETHTVHGETHVTFMTVAEMGLDGDLVPTCDSPANGYCTTGVFAAMYEKHFPDATEKWYEVTDLKGDPRILNGVIDAGCYEFDWRPVFAKDLSASFVEVTAASSNVTETAEKKVALGAGAELSVDWTSPSGDETEYSFTVEVTGSGTLKAYVDDEAEPAVTATEGVRTLSFVRSGDQIAVRFVYEGDDGEAVLSGFQNAFTASISIPDKGIAMTGGLTEPGDYVITEPTTFTLTRTFDSTHLCTGFTTNGVYVAWDDLPGETWTWTVESKATSVRIVAVYMEHQTWYVDPVGGNDANTGFLPNQAKKALLVALTNGVVTAGDTVLAFPGTYDEGGLLAPGTAETITNRVYVPAGVTLKSRDGAAVTHIVGRASPDPVDAKGYGLGPGAVRCVYLGAGASIEGFTIRDGHTHHGAAEKEDNYHGAIKSAGGAWIVDCVVSNCYGSWQSVVSGANAVRSKFVTCKGVNYDACLNGGKYYNCCFGDLTGSYGIYSPDLLVNCTLGVSDGGIRYPGVGGSPCYNCVIAGPIQQGGTFHRCVIAKESYSAASDHLYDADCITNTPRAQLKLDAGDDYRPLAGSPAVDFGCNDYLELIPEKYRTSAYPSGQRVYNGAVDAGAHEYDIRGELGQVLSDGQVAVDAASGGVSNETSAVAIPAGDEMSVTWTPSALETTRFAFKVAFTGAGTLKGYADGATEPAFTVTEDGLVTYDRAGQTPLRLRLVAEGEGAAAHVSSFSNIDAAYILPADGGIAVTGANIGTNLVAAGQRLNFTIRRAYDSTRLSTGFTVDGVAYSWDDYPNGWTHTVDGDDRSTTVLIGATYLGAGEQDWYVDPVNGSDANSGFLPENAKLSAADVITNTALVAGETIWLMPGIHSNGAIAVSGEVTLNRILLPHGVNLASTSGKASDTFVVGAAAREWPENCPGCGVGSVRCLKMSGDSSVSNITFCGGTAFCTKHQKGGTEYPTETFAGVAGAKTGGYSRLFGCVISNNTANTDAGVGNATLVRCRVSDNRAFWYSSGAASCSLYNCIVCDNDGGYVVHQPGTIVNCTLGPNGKSSTIRATGSSSVYNTLIRGALDPIAEMSFYRTYFVDRGEFSKTPIAEYVKVYADGCKTNGEVTVSLDERLMPVRGSCDALDAGNDDYLEHFPAEFANEALVDFYGNPRVLGGAVDIGAVEYDWRKDFAADLGGRLLVPMASGNVVETAEKAVRLADGQALTVAFANADKAKVGRTFPVTVSGGTLTVTVNGAVVASLDASGEWRYEEGAADDVIVFSFAASEDGGFADLARSRSNRGVLLLVR